MFVKINHATLTDLGAGNSGKLVMMGKLPMFIIIIIIITMTMNGDDGLLLGPHRSMLPFVQGDICPRVNGAKLLAEDRRQIAFSVVSQGAHLFCRLPCAALRGACLARPRTSSAARDTSCHVSPVNQSASPPLAAVQITRPGRQRHGDVGF